MNKMVPRHKQSANRTKVDLSQVVVSDKTF